MVVVGGGGGVNYVNWEVLTWVWRGAGVDGGDGGWMVTATILNISNQRSIEHIGLFRNNSPTT